MKSSALLRFLNEDFYKLGRQLLPQFVQINVIFPISTFELLLSNAVRICAVASRSKLVSGPLDGGAGGGPSATPTRSAADAARHFLGRTDAAAKREREQAKLNSRVSQLRWGRKIH